MVNTVRLSYWLLAAASVVSTYMFIATSEERALERAAEQEALREAREDATRKRKEAQKYAVEEKRRVKEGIRRQLLDSTDAELREALNSCHGSSMSDTRTRSLVYSVSIVGSYDLAVQSYLTDYIKLIVPAKAWLGSDERIELLRKKGELITDHVTITRRDRADSFYTHYRCEIQEGLEMKALKISEKRGAPLKLSP